MMGERCEQTIDRSNGRRCETCGRTWREHELTTYVKGLPGGQIETLSWWKDHRSWWHPIFRYPNGSLMMSSYVSNPYESTDSTIRDARSFVASYRR